MRKFLIAVCIVMGIVSFVLWMYNRELSLFTTGIVCFNVATFIWWLSISENIVENSEELQLANERIMRSNYELRDLVKEYQFILEEQLNKAKGNGNASVTNN